MPHINELYDFTITVFIVHEDKVLLVNHPRYDKWIPIGGHIEFDEDPETALFREIKEETGLDVVIISQRPNFDSPGTKALLTPNFMDVHEANPPHKHISLTYFAISKDDNFVLSEEHDGMKWFTRSELDEEQYKLSSAVRFYAEEAVVLASSWS
jgi:ADP-ribose pyrophosphatase YjhB (NUDIX family)